MTVSEHLSSLGRIGLDPRWTLVPAGGAGNIPTFVSLLGAHLDVTVLVDSTQEGSQRLIEFADRGILQKQRLISVASVTGTKEADIEDLFEPAEYLALYSEAFGQAVRESDLAGGDPLIRRIERKVGTKFDHGRPANVLLRKKEDVLASLSSSTLDRFEELFKRINSTLSV
jgi:hypothetical protein